MRPTRRWAARSSRRSSRSGSKSTSASGTPARPSRWPTTRTPDQGKSKLVQSRDLAKGLARNEWERPKADGGRRTYIEIVTPTAGYSIGNDAVEGRLPKRTITGANGQPEHTMSGRRLTATLRELSRLTVIQDMKAHPDRVTALPNQVGGTRAWPALQYRGDYGDFIVLFNPGHEPPAPRALERLGRYSKATAEFDACSPTGATSTARNGPAGAAPCCRHEGPRVQGPATSRRTRHWPRTHSPSRRRSSRVRHVRRIRASRRSSGSSAAPSNGFYYDADAMYVDDGDQMKWQDIAPNVGLAMGNTHNTVFIATNTYLIAMEAPNDDGQAKRRDRARQAAFPRQADQISRAHTSPCRSRRRHAHVCCRRRHDRGRQRHGAQRPVLSAADRQHAGPELEQAGNAERRS